LAWFREVQREAKSYLSKFVGMSRRYIQPRPPELKCEILVLLELLCTTSSDLHISGFHRKELEHNIRYRGFVFIRDQRYSKSTVKPPAS
jgi:hypothetical protein